MLRLDVVEVNIPLLLGLDSMGEFKNNVLDLLICVQPPWGHPTTRKHGLLLYEWERSVLYTDTELRRIRRHFYHARPERIFNLMRRSKDAEATPEFISN